MRGYGQSGFPDAGWTIDDGALHHAAGGGGGDLVTRRRYANFELAFEWRVAAGANSGVMYRVVEADRPSYESGPEYQILDDSNSDAAGTVHGAAALYGLYAAEGAEPAAVGEWNQGRILVFGDHVEHWLNGHKVVDASIGSDDWKKRVAGTKFEPWTAFAAARRGHICLQDHGDEVWYRNVRIRELPPEEARYGERVVLFDGKDLSSFDAFVDAEGVGIDDVWSVQGDSIVCKGKPIGYLYTKRPFTNFVLTLQWRFDAAAGAGNSGVLLRQNGPHRIWPRSIEAQLESGNAGDFWNIGEFPMQVPAARTKGRNTKRTHGTEKPLGEWNTYEIIADDGWVCLRIERRGRQRGVGLRGDRRSDLPAVGRRQDPVPRHPPRAARGLKRCRSPRSNARCRRRSVRA